MSYPEDLNPHRLTRRALVSPLTGRHRRDLWYACIQYRTAEGVPAGVRVLGEKGVGTWDHAARFAVNEVRRLDTQDGR